MKKLCERHLTSLCHANVQCINLRIEIIFSQNLRILMVKTDVKDKFSHFFGCLYGGDAKDSGTSACACGLFSSATTSCFWRGDSRSIAVTHFQHENEKKKNHMEINFIMVVVVIVYNFVM